MHLPRQPRLIPLPPWPPPMFKLVLKTDLPQQLQQASRQLQSGLPSLLQEVGVYVLQEQKLSFEAKSRGGTGADGVKWKPLKESTERRKALKSVRKSKARKDGTRKRRKLAGAVPKSQIGVDRGMLRNSGTPGYAAPDGDGGNVLQVSGNRVVMKYGRSYAGYFDEVRPLFPETAPPAWVEGINLIVRDWIDQQLSGIK